MTLRFTPSGSLQWNSSEETSQYPHLQKHFENNWIEALFYLAAKKISYRNIPVLYYWQGFASKFLTNLCHLPEDETFLQLECPSTDELSEILLNAPPMEGGEYLSLESIEKNLEVLKTIGY